MLTNSVKEVIMDVKDVKVMSDTELDMEIADLVESSTGCSDGIVVKCYSQDLNAMYLAEEKVIVSCELQQDYFDFLDIVTPIPKNKNTESLLWVMVHANARYRAEALLLTKKFRKV
jgi:hypothetical protein